MSSETVCFNLSNICITGKGDYSKNNAKKVISDLFCIGRQKESLIILASLLKNEGIYTKLAKVFACKEYFCLLVLNCCDFGACPERYGK